MTTLTKGNKSIQVFFEDMMYEPTDTDNSTISYIVQAPKIICDNKQIAECIHQKINNFTINLCKELLDKGEENE